MNHRIVVLAFAIDLSTTAACSASDTSVERSSAVSQADSLGSGTIHISPIPFNSVGQKPAWDGTRLDLLVADAWAACSVDDAKAPEWVEFPRGTVDDYLEWVRGRMEGAACHEVTYDGDNTKNPPLPPKYGPGEVLRRWFAQRNDPKCAFDAARSDPSIKTYVLSSAAIDDTPVADSGTAALITTQALASFDPEALRGAARAIRRASVNLCIAQHLRSIAPGSAGGETLLYSAADQRELLETVRERAQIAMVQYAALGLVFATPNAQQFSAQEVSLAERYIPILQQWASPSSFQSNPPNPTPSLDNPALRVMADDFAHAVNLHTTVTREMATLLARSASAHAARGGAADTAADEMWGPSSWRQRMLALLHGGDPLAENGDHSAPWKHPLGVDFPGMSSPNGATDSTYRDWPTAIAAPYSTTNISEPQIAELEKLARAYDALAIKQKPNEPHAMRLDPDGSAMRLYLAVEAGLRTTNCVELVGGACRTFQLTDIALPQGSDPTKGFQSFELWKRHRVTPAHAQTLARQLADNFGFGTDRLGAGAMQDAPGALNMDGKGSIVSLTDEGGNPATYFKASAGTKFREKRVSQIASAYTRFGPFHMPDHIEPTASAAHQGIGETSEEREGVRRMGAIGALVATRDALNGAYSLLGDGPANATFFAQRRRILPLIAGTTGEGSVAVTPTVRMTELIGAGQLRHSVVTQGGGAELPYRWRVTLTTSAGDDWWNKSAPQQYTVIAIPNKPWASNLVLYPQSQSFISGLTIDRITDPAQGAVLGTLSSVRATADADALTQWQFELALPRTSVLDGGWTLLVRKQGAPLQYALLAGRVFLDTIVESIRVAGILNNGVATPRDGQYIGYGGTLNQLATKVMAKDVISPSLPAYDAFGIPMRWVPPTDPQLFLGTQGQDAAAHYLARAGDSARDATAEVKGAINELLRQQGDHVQLAAAAAKSVEVAKLEQRGLCGDTNPSCDTSMVEASINVAKEWDDYALSVPGLRRVYNAATDYCLNGAKPVPLAPTGKDIADRLDCLALNYFGMIPKLRIAKEVANHLYDPAVPTFKQYEGGTFQKVLIAQWSAVHHMRDSIRNVLAVVDAARARAAAFDLIVEHDQARWDAVAEGRCSPDALAKLTFQSACHLQPTADLWGPALALINPAAGASALLRDKCDIATTSVPNAPDKDLTWDDEKSGPSTSTGESVGFGAGYGGSVSYGSGASVSTPPDVPVAQKRRLCEGLESKLGEDQKQALAASIEAFASLAERMTGFVQSVTAVLTAAADGAVLRQQAKLASARQELEVDELRATQATSLKLYRQVHSYDVWRAKALLEDARIASVTARRAIEARFATSLSTLVAAEPFVASPSTWADQIYQYDLNMPAAVGLAIGDAVPDGIYPNVVLDYVGNLDRFVNGFAVARPSATMNDDTEVLSLPGPVGLVQALPAPGATPPLDGRAYSWSFECATATGPTWRSIPASGKPGDACLPDAVSPQRARITFSLDPWARVNGDTANEPYAKRYNPRWARLAVNLVGTGLFNCAVAADPMGCYSQPFLRYELNHVGPAWVSDWNQSWMVLGVPLGRIEGAKALASEQWLDPIGNAWSKPYVSAIARKELEDRPFGGTYDLIFGLGPEARLEHIERVQLLIGSSYWVKQQ